MHPYNILTMSLALAGALALAGCGSDSNSSVDNGNGGGGTTPPTTNYTYDFNSGTSLPTTLTLNASETAGLTATPTLDATQDAGGKGQALALAITAALGEKKLYLQETGHTKASKLSFQVKLSQEAFDAGFTGGKLYAKTGDGWTWSNGDWVSINPDTWTTVTWTPGTDSVDLADIKELGLQFYAGATSTAVSEVKVYVDNILIE